MDKVSFIEMREGTEADFRIIAENDAQTARELPDRILAHLALLEDDDGGYQVDRLTHVLQTATRAECNGADDDWIAAALIHDIGDVLAPFAHDALAADILAPFVRPEVEWAVRHHGLFQRAFNKSLTEEERSEYRRHEGHEHFESTLAFCSKWDQCSFDPDYPTRPLSHFEPLLRRVFTRTPRRGR